MSKAPILIVEDDLEQLSTLASILDNVDYPVETALNGKRALDMLAHVVPSLVITDMVMPDVSGSQIVKFIRGEDRLKTTKIIIVTAFLRYVSPEDQSLANRVLIKPVKDAELRQAVKDLLG